MMWPLPSKRGPKTPTAKNLAPGELEPGGVRKACTPEVRLWPAPVSWVTEHQRGIYIVGMHKAGAHPAVKAGRAVASALSDGVPEAGPPVFVDATGRRERLWR